MDDRAFAALVDEAIAALPPEFLDKIDNLTFAVEDLAPPEVLDELGFSDPLELLGEYLGCPLPERRHDQTGDLPDLIVLYQGAIEACAEEKGEPLAQVIRETLIHEIAHYFGFSEEEMDEIETFWQEEGGGSLP